MVTDRDDVKVYQYDMETKHTMHIYVEHKGNFREVEVNDVEEDEVCDVQEDDVGDAQEDKLDNVHIDDVCDAQEDETEDNGSSQDNEFEVDGVSFDDSEDDRALGLDDYFEDRGRTSGVKVAAKKHKLTPKKVPIVVDNISSSSGVDNEMDINYARGEFSSSDPDASDKEKDPKYPRFKMEDLDKNYKFKVGLEFVSLEEFKEAVTQRSMLKGRERQYVKNDKFRVRVICKSKCGFLALVSKVGNKHAYMMKRWVGTHTCDRILNNISVNSKWVAKSVVARMSSSNGVNIRDIVYEIRSNFFVGITISREWKEKQI